MRQARLRWVLLLPLCVAACSLPDPGAPSAKLAGGIRPSITLSAVTEGAPAPGVTANIQVASGGRQLAVVLPHRWTVSDIYEYAATLSVRQADLSYTPLNNIVLPQKGATPRSIATFPRLQRGRVYRVTIEAKGNEGGTAATTVMNTMTPTQVSLDLSQEPVPATLSAQATVVLDPTGADPAGTIQITPPSVDGVFAAPSASPTIEPVAYRVEQP